MNRKFQVIGLAALLFIAFFAGDALASATEMWFSSDPVEVERYRVTAIRAGGRLWVVVYDPDRNIDSTKRNVIPASEIRVINPNTGAELNPAWLGKLKAGAPNRFLVETGPDTSIFVLADEIIIGARHADGTHIMGGEAPDPTYNMWIEGNWIYDPFNQGIRTRLGVSGRFEDGDTLIGIYQSVHNPSDVASAMVQVQLLVELPGGGYKPAPPATIAWNEPSHYSNIESWAEITVIDRDENLDPDKPESVPIFIIVNPGTWNPVKRAPEAFDFDLAVSPAVAAIPQGGETNAAVTVGAAGTPEEVTLSICPVFEPILWGKGIRVRFAPRVGRPEPGVPFTSTMTITAAAIAAVGTHEITITATGVKSGLQRRILFNLTVEPIDFDFSVVSPVPAAATIRPTQTTTATVAVQLMAGEPEPVTLAAELPEGVTGITVSLDPDPATDTPQPGVPFTATMTIFTTPDATLGAHEITITATTGVGGLERTTTFVLTVVPDAFDFNLAVSPTEATISQNDMATADVTVGLKPGITEEVALSICPVLEGILWGKGIDVDFDHDFAVFGTPPFTSTMTITAAAIAAVGTHEITITATGVKSGLQRRILFNLTVEPIDFDFSVVSPVPAAATILPDQMTTATVAVQLMAGEPELVTFGTRLLPTGISVSFDPLLAGTPQPHVRTPFTATTMTITATPYAAVGAHEITITATGVGGLERTTTFALAVTTVKKHQIASMTSANSFQMLLRYGGVTRAGDPITLDTYPPGYVLPTPVPIRWHNIFYDRFIMYPTTTLAPNVGRGEYFNIIAQQLPWGAGVVRVVFFAEETGANTGKFVLRLEDIQAELGFTKLRSYYVLAAFYVDPNDFSDVAIDTVYARSAAPKSPKVTFAGAEWIRREEFHLGRDRVNVKVDFGPISRDDRDREEVVVQIFSPHSADREWIILDEAGAKSPFFRARYGLGLQSVWDATGAGFLMDPVKAMGRDFFDIGNKDLNTSNRSAVIVRFNAVEVRSYPTEPNIITGWDYPRVAAFAEMEITSNLVFDGVTGILNMRFINAVGEEVIGYTVGESVFIEIYDPDQNEDTRRRERIVPGWGGVTNHQPFNPGWVLQDTGVVPVPTVPALDPKETVIFIINPRTGKWAPIEMWETDLNTGIFRSIEPVALVEHLDARTGDTILAFFQDPSDHSDVAVVSIRVVAVVNHPPVAKDDAYEMLMGEVLTVPAALGVLANDTDRDGDQLRVELVTGPDHGVLVLNEDGSFTYTPNPGWRGIDSFIYRARDELGGYDEATVTITVLEEELVLEIDEFIVVPGLSVYFYFTGTGAAETFTVWIFNMLGREVVELTEFNVGPGDRVTWDGRDEDGVLLAKGPYIFVAVLIGADDRTFTIRGTAFRK